MQIYTSGLDVDSSEDEGDYDLEAEDEDIELQKDFKGFNITSEYFPKQIRVEELIKLTPLFPELNDFQVQTDTKFKDSIISSSEGKICFSLLSSSTFAELYNYIISLLDFK